MILVKAFATAFLACFVLLGTISLYLAHRTRRLATARAGGTFADFRAEFEGQGVPDDLLAAVYRRFEAWQACTVRGFPVRASDPIGSVYGMGGEDLDEAILAILDASGRRRPDSARLDQMPPIETVGDLVGFLAQCDRA